MTNYSKCGVKFSRSDNVHTEIFGSYKCPDSRVIFIFIKYCLCDEKMLVGTSEILSNLTMFSRHCNDKLWRRIHMVTCFSFVLIDVAFISHHALCVTRWLPPCITIMVYNVQQLHEYRVRID